MVADARAMSIDFTDIASLQKQIPETNPITMKATVNNDCRSTMMRLLLSGALHGLDHAKPPSLWRDQRPSRCGRDQFVEVRAVEADYLGVGFFGFVEFQECDHCRTEEQCAAQL